MDDDMLMPSAPATAGDLNGLIAHTWNNNGAAWQFNRDGTVNVSVPGMNGMSQTHQFELSADGILTIEMQNGLTLYGTWDGRTLAISGREVPPMQE